MENNAFSGMSFSAGASSNPFAKVHPQKPSGQPPASEAIREPQGLFSNLSRIFDIDPTLG